MIAVERDEVTVVGQEPQVTVVSVTPNAFVVTQVDEVTVVAPREEVSVISMPVGHTVVPVYDGVTVVAGGTIVEGGSYTGPQFFYSPTPPTGASINDIWIKT